MEKKIILFLLLISNGITIGQEQFSKIHNMAIDQTDLYRGVVHYNDKFYTLYGQYPCNNGKVPCAGYACLDKYGNVLWDRIIEHNNDSLRFFTWLQNMTFLENEQSFVGIYNCNTRYDSLAYVPIIKFDTLGNLLDSVHIRTGGDRSHSQGIYARGNEIFVNIEPDNKNFIYYKLSNKLEFLDTLRLFNGKQLSMTKLAFIPNGDIAISYSYWHNSNVVLRIKIYDSKFNLKKTSTSFSADSYRSTLQIVNANDGGFLVNFVNNEVWGHEIDPFPEKIIRLDSSLNFMWEHNFFGLASKEVGSLKHIGNGKFLGAGASDYFYYYPWGEEFDRPIYVGWAFVIDENGEMIWDRTILDKRGGKDMAVWDFDIIEDGYVFVGDSDGFNDKKSWIFTLDKDGCFNGTCGSYIIITDDSTAYSYVHPEYDAHTTKTQEIENENSNIFPNPSYQHVNIKWDEKYANSRNKKLKFYDINGNLLKEITTHAPENRISMFGYPSGVYLFELYVDGKLVKTHKHILESNR